MSVKLTLVLSGRTLQRHEFDDFDRLRIGRNEDCDVTIDNLGISRYHCEIVRKPGFVQLRDLNSGNGTYVNGSRVESYNLNNGDLISLGKFSIKYESDDDPGQIEEDRAYDARGDIQEGVMTLAMNAATLAKKHRQQMTRNTGYLVVDGKDRLIDKSVFVFGREVDADLQITGWFCPRVAAILIRDESGFRILDVSPRGQSVSVNGIRKRDTFLHDNDLVLVRNVRATFRRGLPVGQSG